MQMIGKASSTKSAKNTKEPGTGKQGCNKQSESSAMPVLTVVEGGGISQTRVYNDERLS